MTDETATMPLNHALRIPFPHVHIRPPSLHLSPLGTTGVAMGFVGMVSQGLVWAFPGSVFAMAAHSDIGQWIAIGNAVGVAVIAGAQLIKAGNERIRLMRKERQEARHAAREAMPAPDSKEADDDPPVNGDALKEDRVRRRREETGGH